jgi:hypothetical protein
MDLFCDDGHLRHHLQLMVAYNLQPKSKLVPNFWEQIWCFVVII